ncbi:MAG: radical SAM protein [Desulfovibrio sp.]|jgi:pyruvate-formate lyase-activating enzyme|nr:radical SAM protein [Desulfovibrio sp.]
MKNNNPAYGFSERLPEAFPSQIVIDVTECCNLACAHCLHAEFVKHPKYAARHMSTAIHDKLVEEAACDGKGQVRYLRYTAMGEPLLHPEIFSFLIKAKRDSGTVVTLTTNGTLLSGDAVERLLDTGVDIVDISIDAFSPEVYKAVRRGGDRERTYKNVKALLAARNQRRSGTKILTTFIEQPLNQGEADSFRRFWLEHGAEDVIIRRLHSQAGGRKDIAARLKEKAAGLSRRPCLYPWERLSVGSGGLISFCPANWSYFADFADFADISIKDAWQGAFMQKLRTQHLKNCFENNPLCRDCPDWAQTRWPHEGRSYADMVADMTAASRQQIPNGV